MNKKQLAAAVMSLSLLSFPAGSRADQVDAVQNTALTDAPALTAEQLAAQAPSNAQVIAQMQAQISGSIVNLAADPAVDLNAQEEDLANALYGLTFEDYPADLAAATAGSSDSSSESEYSAPADSPFLGALAPGMAEKTKAQVAQEGLKASLKTLESERDNMTALLAALATKLQNDPTNKMILNAINYANANKQRVEKLIEIANANVPAAQLERMITMFNRVTLNNIQKKITHLEGALAQAQKDNKPILATRLQTLLNEAKLEQAGAQQTSMGGGVITQNPYLPPQLPPD